MTLALPSYHKPSPSRSLVLATGSYGVPAFYPATPANDDVSRPPVRLSELSDAELLCLQTELRAFFVDVSGDVLDLTEKIEAERARRG